MESVRKILQQVWAMLQSNGVQGDLSIIEYIAWLLTTGLGKIWTIDKKAQPQPPRYTYNPNNPQLQSLLKVAAERIDSSNDERGLAQLFNRHVLFYASPSHQRDNYPTPRHLIDFMLDLIDVRPEHDFADFTCGSGGFLIPLLPTPWPPSTARRGRRTAQLRQVTYGKRVGIDISPNWTRIANANIMLNTGNDTIARIETGDALRLFSPNGGPYATELFDCIAMSPPLGLSLSIDGYEQLSDERFISLLLDQLKDNGRGVTLVSDKLLNGRGGLCEHLVVSGQLAAVIRLADGIPPFIHESANILFVNKGQPSSDKAIWFLNIECDGYPSGPERDLTAEPSTDPGQNDLLFAREVVKITGRGWRFDPHNPISYKQIIRQEKHLGVVIKAPKEYRLHIRLIEKDEGANLAIEYSELDDRLGVTETYIVPLKGVDSYSLSAYESNLAEHDGFVERLIAITSDGRVLGTRESHTRLHNEVYDLQPATYIDWLTSISRSIYSPPAKGTEESASQESTQLVPADILAEPETPSPPEPLRLLAPLEVAPRLLGVLSSRQRKVWEAIQRLDSKRPYFTAEQLARQLEHHDVSATLELFVRFGLLTPVTLTSSATRSPLQCYRRTAQAELEPVLAPDCPDK